MFKTFLDSEIKLVYQLQLVGKCSLILNNHELFELVLHPISRPISLSSMQLVMRYYQLLALLCLGSSNAGSDEEEAAEESFEWDAYLAKNRARPIANANFKHVGIAALRMSVMQNSCSHCDHICTFIFVL